MKRNDILANQAVIDVLIKSLMQRLKIEWDGLVTHNAPHYKNRSLIAAVFILL